MDQFSFFFAFYGLILGLAVAELLSGFAGMVRGHALKKLDAQTALAALLTFAGNQCSAKFATMASPASRSDCGR